LKARMQLPISPS